MTTSTPAQPRRAVRLHGSVTPPAVRAPRAVAAWVLLACATLLAATASCVYDGGGGASVRFHASQPTLPSAMHDTGFQPASSPVQVRVVVASAGDTTVDAAATARRGDGVVQLTGDRGSGRLALAVRLRLQVFVKIELPGLPGRSLRYEGPLMNAPDINLDAAGEAVFDPFLLDGRPDALATATIMPQQVLSVPLAGAVGVPGIAGTLTLRVGGTLTARFHGTCASIADDGTAQYLGELSTHAALQVEPTVVLEALGMSRTVGPVMIPVDLDGPPRALDLGTQRATAFASTAPDDDAGASAQHGRCTGADGGAGDAATPRASDASTPPAPDARTPTVSDASTPPAPDAAVADPCAALASCGACTPAAGCGWCTRTNACASGTAAGPREGACAPADWRWLPSTCTAPPSSPCGACASGTACDATTRRCVARWSVALTLRAPPAMTGGGAWDPLGGDPDLALEVSLAGRTVRTPTQNDVPSERAATWNPAFNANVAEILAITRVIANDDDAASGDDEIGRCSGAALVPLRAFDRATHTLCERAGGFAITYRLTPAE